MPDDLRARIVEALEECRTLIPEAQADAVLAAIKQAGAVTEYGQQMSGGGWHLRWDDPVVEEEWPTKDWIEAKQRHGGVVGRRTVIVVKDWKRVPRRRKPAAARAKAGPQAAGATTNSCDTRGGEAA